MRLKGPAAQTFVGIDGLSDQSQLNPVLNSEADLDRMFQALADPTRRKILDRLSRGSASVSELAKPFDMSLPAIFQHLQVLEQSGLVTTKKRGRVRTCTLHTGALAQAEQWINARRTQWEDRLDRLGKILDELTDIDDY